ncbi:MAPEG family protein [Neptunicella marina]|uniref:MAPEG family protein n=1 Tax=Neptunicella marina TaxID=2125989 RepID=A0A8J6ISA0_9ALTE|nr:MAPEG family protein [Neptunicella marina]MBC3764787.1 MAPEG family protein [Neptunicella marina]
MLITPIYAGILALFYLLLSVRVVQKRFTGISLGDGGNESMQRRIRAHANFAEYVPLLLIMIGMLELGRFPVLTIHILGSLLVLARVLHGYALAYTPNWAAGRKYGAALTFGLLLVCGIMCIYLGLTASASVI